jgi:xanthine/CO dehydrogenase XdhC/CoxF family maturation factor
MFQGFRGNPVLIDRHLFPELLSLAGDVGCRAIFGNHPGEMLKVPVDDVGVLLDVDTKADLERFRQIHATGSLDPELLGIADLEGRGERPELVIAGNDQVAKALALFGNALNYTVTIVDPLAQLVDFPGATRVLHALDLTRFGSDAGTYVVVASRGRFDEEAVEQALNSEARYVALIANKKRAAEIVERLANDKRERLKAPAGLAIGAESPAEIALSVMAEIVSVRHGAPKERRTGGPRRP